VTVLVRHGSSPLFPRLGNVLGQVQRVDAGMALLDVGPERTDQDAGQAGEAAVVETGAAFFQVAD
jgi:hypothetical protein